ncbi:MAG TPA: hypothetical protein VGE72_20420 [Azospirillum sp.]
MQPIFARLAHQLDKAEQELARIEDAVHLFAAMERSPASDWARRTSIAGGVEGVYSGLEGILKGIAEDIDGHLPQGGAWHAKLLEVMALDIGGVRPAVLGAETHALLDDLRRFRHAVRSHYGIDLRDADIGDNLERVRRVLPLFRKDFEAFVAAMGAA